MIEKRHWLVRLFILLFSVSVSVSVLPSNIINVHGLFGEVNTSVVTEDTEQATEEISVRRTQKAKQTKGINIFNSWFELAERIVCICFGVYCIRLPRGDTIITLKVRMDN